MPGSEYPAHTWTRFDLSGTTRMESTHIATDTAREPIAEAPKRPRWWPTVEPYAYLIYLAFLVFEPMSDEGRWMPTLVLVGIFLPLYVLSVHLTDAKDRPKLFATAAAVAALGVVGVGFHLNANATIFFIYASAMATHNTTAKTAAIIVVLTLAVLTAMYFFSHVPHTFRWALFLPAWLLVPGIAASQVIQNERMRQNARLRLSQEEVERLAAIAERERISRDLHDLLGHTLSTITLKSALAARLATSDPKRAGQEMRDVESISRDGLDQVREAVRGYRTTGLAEEVAGVRQALGAADIAFEMALEPVDLTPIQESALALALREGATNVLRHSGATRAQATVTANTDAVVLTLTDNGCGGGRDGFGISGLRDRIGALGGRVSRTTDDGTTLTVALPRSDAGSATQAAQRS